MSTQVFTTSEVWSRLLHHVVTRRILSPASNPTRKRQPSGKPMNPLHLFRWMFLLLLQAAAASSLQAATYYVATNGDDTRTPVKAQSISTPWKTIQKAASNMVAGDTCQIRSGTYRETVTVPNSGTSTAPITFQAYGNEVVTISGATSVKSWQLESPNSPNIYYTTAMNWTLGDGNQVFQGSGTQASLVMKPEARWPNAGSQFPWQDSSSPTSPDWSYVDSAGYTSGINGWFSDAQLPTKPNGYWNGAMVHIMSGAAWTMQNPKVTGYLDSTRTISTDDANGASALAMSPGNEYYLSGIKGEMDSAGEWFYDSTLSRLYFYSTLSCCQFTNKRPLLDCYT